MQSSPIWPNMLKLNNGSRPHHAWIHIAAWGPDKHQQTRGCTFETTPSFQLLKCQSSAMRCGVSSVNTARTAPPKISKRPPTRGSTCNQPITLYHRLAFPIMELLGYL